MTKYVAGLLFTEDKQEVILIHKKKGPSALINKWNAIGGKIEEGETSLEAMSREGLEEAGINPQWDLFLLLRGENWQVDFYSAFSDKDVQKSHTCEEEKVLLFYVDSLSFCTLVPNLYWIIPMALGHLNDNVQVYEVLEKEIYWK